ncbi:hypothetical protein GCM10022226_33350 [Sphaerisporangium flaviroseum]|uniref:DUF3040 domain-containing protein n=1 Tax=Sphaerisporangium flaviroseum TaxID=509199 RepID=A0ABP7I4I7_9ACTN
MSSAFLYLGIVVMWLCVLVPMWLRRDRHTVDIAELYNEEIDGDGSDGSDGDESDNDSDGEDSGSDGNGFDGEGSDGKDGDTLTDVPVSGVPGARAAIGTDPADDEITMDLLPTAPRTRSDSTAQPGTRSEAAVRPGTRSESVARPGESPIQPGTHNQGKLGGSGHSSASGQEAPAGTPPARQDASGGTVSPELSKESPSGETPSQESSSHETSPSDESLSYEDLHLENPSPTECRRRARVMARRRRWLLWTVLLQIASIVTAAVGVAPWWSVAPAGLLLVSYLAVLRIAVTVDTERRVEAAKARAERERLERIEQERRRELELAAQQAEAEILEFRRRAEPFDQYADRSRRAVGD